MIVVSGALVLVALIFLIIGLLQEGLLMIWLSIGTSVVAGVFLLLGALQRRGTPAAAGGDSAGTGADALERVTAVSVRSREDAAAPAADGAAAEPAAAAGGSEGDVYVVPGRPRYHVQNCRFLAGRPDIEAVPVEQARDDGFSSCGVCKPDAALAAAAAEPDDEPADDTTADDTAAFEPVADATEPEFAEETPAPAKKAAAKRTRTAAATTATATVDAATETPAKPARKAAAKPAAAKPAAAKPAAAKPAATKPAATKATGTAQVVVIPDRGKFHVETCRFVRDVPGTVTLSKTTAKRQGYAPCGVCKP